MNIDKYGRTIVNANEAFDFLYSGKINNFEGIFLEDPKLAEQFNSAIKQNADSIPLIENYQLIDIPLSVFDESNRHKWFMPEKYNNFPMVEFLLDKTQNEEQYQRVVAELDLFIQYDMMHVLNYLKYLVDTMRTHSIVWGVGRGSSVASYVLYLIGIHKIDSIKYELDIKEFLK
jgi:DNA polymerase III alpha subunit